MAQRKNVKLAGEALWQYALRALGRRAHSVAELRDKLRGKAESMAEADQVLRRLKESGYLDDRRFAASFAEVRLTSQGLGRSRALRELRARRVAPAVAEQAVREAYKDVDEVELIRNFLARKFRTVRLDEHLQDPRHLAAAYRKLRLAGFSAGNSIRVLKQYSEEADQLEETEEPRPEEE
ncbi:MAG: recombination regulator RecX [Bryobacteraceae bacterium]|nr:recombination regulator RecX [Bryobacteraceae bacterium]